MGQAVVKSVDRMGLMKSALREPEFQAALAEVMPKGAACHRMIRGALTAIQLNPKLLECDPVSFKMELMTAAQFGFDLSPALGEAYLVPFRDNRRNRVLCKMISGYKGLIKLMQQSPQVRSVSPVKVHQNDKFIFQRGTQPRIDHAPAFGNRGAVIGFYCVVALRDGACVFEVMSKEECLEHGRKYSRTFNDKDSKWQDKNTQDEMCLKTVIRKVAKYVPISVEDPLAAVLQREEAIDVMATGGGGFFEGAMAGAGEGEVEGEGEPMSRSELKERIAGLCQSIPAENRAGIVVPDNLDECGTSELEGILAALELAV